MTIIDDLRSRALVQDVSDEDGLRKLGKGESFYVGFDPTAPSLQIGNLVPIIVAMRLGKASLHPIILFGGSTGAIGDPSGKSVERQLLARSVLESNIEKQKAQALTIFGRVGVEIEFVNNYDWTQGVTVLDFLRDTGKHFTVNYMIAKETVKTRLSGEGMSYAEFSYMLLQAFDFLHLYESKRCRLQIGGSDQWGNITAGLELIRKKVQGNALGFSIPLLTDSQGRKFGKTEGGTVWLDPSMTSPFKFHQFWLNVDDADVIRYLKIFTFLSAEEILRLENELKNAPGQRAAHHALADEVCTLVHGMDATNAAKQSAQVLFGGSFDGLTTDSLLEIFSDVPSSSLERASLKDLTLTDIFVASGALKSKGEAKRLISSGGAYLNNERLSDPNQRFSDSNFSGCEILVLRTGKKSYFLAKII